MNKQLQTQSILKPFKIIKSIALVIATLMSINSLGQIPTFNWGYAFGYSLAGTNGKCVKSDAGGNTFVTGYFIGSGVDADPSAGSAVLNSNGNADAFIVKYDPAGNLVWAKSFGGINNDYGNSLSIDASGNIIITGYFSDICDFDPGVATYTLASFGSASDDIFVLKLDPLGNFIWAKKLGGTGPDYGLSVTTDATGNIYTTGNFYATADFDPSGVIYNLTSAGSEEIFVSKLDPSGNFVWAKQLGGTNSDFGNSIIVDGSSNVIVAGVFSGTADFDPSVTNFYINSGGGYDSFISKFDLNGNLIFAKSFSGNNHEYLNSIALDASGSIFSTGYIEGSSASDFDPGVGTFTLSPISSSKDIFVSKLDNNGNFIFAKQMGGSTNDVGNSISVDFFGQIYLTGSYNGTCDFDPSVSSFNLSTASGDNAYICKLDVSGNYLWAGQLGISGASDAGLSIATDNSGNVYTTGYLTNYLATNMDLDPTAGVYNVLCQPNYAWFFVSKMAGCAIPTVPAAITGTNSVCSTSIKTYSIAPVSGATSYSWALPSGWSGNSTTNTISITTGTASGTMSVSAVNICGSSSAQTLSITVNALPTISVNSGAICSGQSFTMSPSGASTYTYSGGSAVVSPTANATYSVSGTSAAGCVSASSAISSVTVNAKPTITVNSGSICSGQSFTMSPSGASTYTYSGGSSVVSPTANATYSVSGTSAAGCVSASSAVSSVTVNTKPTITVNSGSICSGQSFTMSPSGASTYTFSGGSAVVSPTANASYSVSGTSAAGCVSASSAVSSVTVNALPTISVNSGAICSGQSFTMSPSGASTYTYSSGSAVVSPATTTSYSVTGTSAAGCLGSNTAVSTVTVTGTLTVTISGSNSVCNGQAVNLTAGGASTYSWNTGSTSSTIAPTPTTTTTYSVIGSSGSCSNTAVTTVTVNTLPTISVNSGTICSGQSFTMSPSGASTYTYSGSSAVVSPTANATYSVSGTSAAGCISASSAVSNITVNALPIVNATTSNTLMCTGETVTLTASGATSYTFNPGGVGASVVVSPTVTSNYTVSGTAANGCNNTTVLTQSVSLCTGIQPVVQSIEANVYPNPFKNKINVMVSAAKQTIVVYNALGQAVYTAPSPSEKAGDEIVIDLTNQPSGIYFIKIGSITKKLIKE